MQLRIVVLCTLLTGCLPQPQLASTTPQPQPQPQYVQQPPPPQPQPAPAAPAPTQPTDPYTQQQPPPAPTQPVQPVQPVTPQPYPPQPYPSQPYQPYPSQPYYGQPYQTYPAQPIVVGPPAKSHIYDGEVIGDFAAVGALASIDILTRNQFDNSSANSFVVLAGLAGGAGVGYMLTEKYDIDAGAAHATTTGLLLGIANGALLIQPSGATDADAVLGLLVAGSAAGATGGFIYGQQAKLTAGQAMFVGNLILLGASTAALGAITGSRDGKYGAPENAALLAGTDGGAVIGALIAPRLDWSYRRAKVVTAGTFVGAFVGGMLSGLLTQKKNSDGTTSSTDANGDAVTAAMTAGLWGGFGLAILMTKDDAPDPKYVKKGGSVGPAPVRAPTAAPAPASVLPWVGPEGTFGVMTAGSF